MRRPTTTQILMSIALVSRPIDARHPPHTRRIPSRPSARSSARSSCSSRRRSRARTRRRSSRRATLWRPRGSGHARGRSRRRHLGVAIRGWKLDGASRSRERPGGRRHARPVLESSVVRHAGSRLASVQQGRSEPADVVGHPAGPRRIAAESGAMRGGCPTKILGPIEQTGAAR